MSVIFGRHVYRLLLLVVRMGFPLPWCDVPRRDVVSCKLVLDVVAGCELVYLFTVMFSFAFWSILVVDRRRKISNFPVGCMCVSG